MRKDDNEIYAEASIKSAIPESDVLTAQAIRAYLPQDCPAANVDIAVYDTIESTNKTAKELALSSVHGTTVIADRQTAGRGRYSRSFYSPSGSGLYMSLILDPSVLRFEDPTAITAFAAVAVCDAIRAVTGKQAGIKWVNDLFLDQKKVCGILAEAVTDPKSGTIGRIVLGIGVNVTGRDFPEELRDIAGSVCPEGAPADLRNRLCAAILERLLPLKMPSQREVFAAYRQRLNMLGREVTVQQGELSYRATAEDIDEHGHLILTTADGKRRSLSSGEIRIRL